MTSLKINKTKSRSYLFCLLILAVSLFCFSTIPQYNNAEASEASENIYLYNPYRFVDFSTFESYNAVLHNHTTESGDGTHTSQVTVDKYAEIGFDFVAFTDHDVYKSVEDRGITDFKGTIGIGGTEFHSGNSNQHIVSLFSDVQRRGDTIKEQITNAVADSGNTGRFIIAHPGMYTLMSGLNDTQAEKYSALWYKNLFEDKEVLGIEAYNSNDRYSSDRATWDRLLIETLPERPIWGFAGDDNHGALYGYNVVRPMLAEKSLIALKQSLETGSFFASSFKKTNPATLDSRYGKTRWDFVPTVTNIAVDTQKGEIKITAENYTKIEWYTGNAETGSTLVGVGNAYNYKENYESLNGYVRPMLYYQEGNTVLCETIVQPFGVGAYDENSGYFNYAPPLDETIDDETPGGDETPGTTTKKKKGCGSSSSNVIIFSLSTVAFVASKKLFV